MNYRLRPGVSFCETSGRLLFLDIRRDRYFCLGEEAEESFGRLAHGEPLRTIDEESLMRLSAEGLLIAAPGAAPPTPCLAPAEPARSLLDESSRPGVALPPRSMLRLAGASLMLRLTPLHLVLERLCRRKAKLRLAGMSSAASLEDAASALRNSALLATPLDRCLPRSIAAAHFLLDRQVPADLVIGVHLNPFCAHCWTQSGDVVVNDQLDEIRRYTPILVV